MKLTDWFPVHIKPVRIGWYEGKYSGTDDTAMFWFDGNEWRYSPKLHASFFGNAWKEDRWRGLAEKPV